MQSLRSFFIALAMALVMATVCEASNVALAPAKTLPSDITTRLKKWLWRSSVPAKLLAGATAIFLTSSVYGNEAGRGSDVPAVTEEATNQELDKHYDILSLYFGRGRNYMSESTGAFTMRIGDVEYEHLGDYYGLPTTMDEKIDKYIGGLGAHLGDTGIEVKFFFFGGTNRANSGIYYPHHNDGKIFKDGGNMPNIIFAGTREIFGINAQKGFVGIGDKALLTFHLGPSFNIHPVTGTITSQVPSKTALYVLKNATGNTDSWEKKEHSQHLTEIPAGIGGHLGPGLLWQVNLNLKNFTSDESDEYDTGVGLGMSYVGTVTHNGIHTHLLLLRLSLSVTEY